MTLRGSDPIYANIQAQVVHVVWTIHDGWDNAKCWLKWLMWFGPDRRWNRETNRLKTAHVIWARRQMQRTPSLRPLVPLVPAVLRKTRRLKRIRRGHRLLLKRPGRWRLLPQEKGAHALETTCAVCTAYFWRERRTCNGQ